MRQRLVEEGDLVPLHMARVTLALHGKVHAARAVVLQIGGDEIAVSGLAQELRVIGIAFERAVVAHGAVVKINPAPPSRRSASAD